MHYFTATLTLHRLNGETIKLSIRRRLPIRVKETKRLIAEHYGLENFENVILYEKGKWAEPIDDIEWMENKKAGKAGKDKGKKKKSTFL